jgi:hypothetical protein
LLNVARAQENGFEYGQVYQKWIGRSVVLIGRDIKVLQPSMPSYDVYCPGSAGRLSQNRTLLYVNATTRVEVITRALHKSYGTTPVTVEPGLLVSELIPRIK